MYKVLTIAGSDCSGGAGIQADLKTILAHKMYGMSVITALTAQNTMGVSEVFDVSPEFVGAQLDAIFTDIFPDSVKIGMVANAEVIEVIAHKLKQYGAKNIVLDPVMVATSGSELIKNSALDTLIKQLFPIVDLITPNLYEASILSGIKIDSKIKMEEGAEMISELNQNSRAPAILIKGGHLSLDADDLLYLPEEKVKRWFSAERIDNTNTHGTGCTLSSAIASYLAKGESITDSVAHAKHFLMKALNAKLDLGQGQGPLDHSIRFDDE